VAYKKVAMVCMPKSGSLASPHRGAGARQGGLAGAYLKSEAPGNLRSTQTATLFRYPRLNLRTGVPISSMHRALPRNGMPITVW